MTTYDNDNVDNNTEKAVFVNEYTANPVTLGESLTGDKYLTGKTLIDGEFFFEVTNMQTQEKTLVTHSVDTTELNGKYRGHITFLEGLTFDQAGTYIYEIREQIPTHPVTGTKYDTSVYRYVVTVEDDASGQLKAATSLEEWNAETNTWIKVDAIVFENEYAPESTTVTIPVLTKVLTGNRHDPLAEGEFEFKLELVSASVEDGIELPQTTTVTNDANGNILFGNITFTKAGTYTIKAYEVKGDKPGMTYDDTVLTATIEVVDNRNGVLTPIVREYFSTLQFENTYTSTGEFDFTITKELSGREWTSTDKFEFEVVILDETTQNAVDNGDLVLPAENTLEINANTPNKQVTSPRVIVNKEGTYKFIVREVTGTIAGVNYDSQPREVTVTAVDQNNGTIKVDYTVTDENNYGLTFKNIYDTESTHISGHDNLTVTKNFVGRDWLDSDVFTFELAAGDQTTADAIAAGKIEMPNTTLYVTNANKAHPHFGDIVFHEVGTYTFTITEKASGIAGVTDDEDNVRKVVVIVADNGQGALVALIHKDNTSDDLVFTNTYSYDPTTIEGFEITKVITGRNWFDTDSFEFELTAGDEETLNAITAGKVVMKKTTLTLNKTAQTGQFGQITFNETGTYKFYINEVEGDVEGMTYDQSVKEIIVVVTDKDASGKPTGQLTATVSTTPAGEMTFTNVYTPNATTAQIEVNKVLQGLEMKRGKFRFHITAITEGAPMPASNTVTNGNNAAKDASIADFGTITYTKPGTYKYEIVEVEGTLEGVTYDISSKRVDVVVTYDETTGLLSATVNYLVGNTFTNTYKGTPVELVGSTNLKVTKELVGRPNNKWLASDKFTFKIAANNPKTQEAINNGKIIIDNDTLVITNANKDNAYFENITFTEAEDGYEFVVYEVAGEDNSITYSDARITVAIDVKDSGTGKLYIVKKGENKPLEFTNIYKAEGALDLTINKVIDADRGWDEDDEFLFEVVILDQATQTALEKELIVSEKGLLKTATQTTPNTLKVTEDNQSVSTGRFTFKAEGTYQFVIREIHNGIGGIIYDETPRYVTVKVTDNDNGTMKVEYDITKDGQKVNDLTFVNGYEAHQVQLEGHTNLVVKKEFTGRDNNAWLASDEFRFELIADPDHSQTQQAIVSEDVVLPETPIAVASSNKVHAHFGDITFKAAGTYKFVIREIAGDIPGVTYDTNEVVVTVVVEDRGTGFLTITQYSTDKEIKFTNTYNDAAVTIEKTQSVNGGNATTEKLTVREGNTVTYYLTVTNDHVDPDKVVGTATNVVVTDTIPEGLTLVEDSISEGGVNTDGIITWNLGSLADGESKTVSFSVRVPDVSQDTTWENMAAVTYKNPDGDEEKDDSDKVIIEQGTPNVIVEKTQTLSGSTATKDIIHVNTGDEVEYTITVKNTGSESADNIVITDTIPKGLEIVSHNGSLDARTVTWRLETLAANSEASFKVKVRVPKTEGQFKIWTNIADVKFGNDPTDPNEPEPSNPVSIVNSVDVVIDATKNMTGDRTSFVDGEFQFTIEKVTENAPMPNNTTVGNEGNAVVFGPLTYNEEGTYIYKISEVNAGETIDGVKYDDSVYYVKVVIGKVEETIEIAPTIPEQSDQITPAVPTEGELEQLQVTGTLEETGTISEPVTETTVTYTVQSKEYYKDADCTQKVDAIVFENTYYDANVTISKSQQINDGERTAAQTVVREDDKVTYYLTVTNNGQGVAKDVVITDEIPEGLTLVEGSISDGGVNTNGTIQWTVETLGANETKEVSFSVIVPDVTEDKIWTNVASVKYTNPDGDEEPEKPSDEVEIKEGAPKVTINKQQSVNDGTPTDATLEVLKDDIVTYFITVENTGTEIADGVVVRDTIPAGLTLVDGTISNHGSVTDNVITWVIDNLEVGEKDTLTFQVKVPKVNVDTQWHNVASVYYENDPTDPTDPTPSNEVVIEEGVPQVNANKEQSVNGGLKATDKLTVIEGDQVTYYITVKNTGTGTATDVVVKDKVPAGLEVITDSINENGTYSNGTVQWTFDRLAENEEKIVQFTVIVPDVTEDTVWKNIAVVTTGDDPENPSNEVEIKEGAPDVTVEKFQALNNGVQTKNKLTAKEGDEITYTIIVKNTGTEAIKGLVIADELPEGLTYVENSATANGILANGSVQWTFDELAINQEVSVQFKVKVPAVTQDTTWQNVAVAYYDNDPTQSDTPSNPVEVVEKYKPVSIDTGDYNNVGLWASTMIISLVGIIVTSLKRRKEDF